MDWKRRLHACFDPHTHVFVHGAVHAQHRVDMLRVFLLTGVPLDALEREVAAHLRARGCSPAHIERELEALRDPASYHPPSLRAA